MDLTDYEETAAPVDYTPRPNASQAVAKAKRAHPRDEPPVAAPKRPQQLIIGIVGVLSVIGVFAMAISQLGAPAKPLQTQPTSAPARVFEIASTAAPAPTSAPQPTEAPPFTSVPTEAALVAPVEIAPQVLYVEPVTIEQPAAEPATGQKPADDRAARHAAAVARDQQAHGQKAP